MTTQDLASLLLTLAAVAGFAGLVGLARLLRRRRALGGADSVSVVASDTGAAAPVLLRDRELGLCGKPDYILREGDAEGARLVALELKPTRRANRVYESDAVQVSAYAMLLRSAYGEEAAPFGYLRYATGSFRVGLTPALERQVMEIAAAIRRQRSSLVVHRSHDNPGRCAGCSMRQHCDERLA